MRDTKPDKVMHLTFEGQRLVVRRWFDTGNIAVWRRWSRSYYAMMKKMANRYSGSFSTAEQYESWYFHGSVADKVINELVFQCNRRP
jgi:hypothetical protein